ncbi:MAG TPA: hypothetical protein VM942_05880, partial [Acidimicrobiales bacterium]|nr:hypothetical protein [Acidimicrobiales bacterium]
RRSPDDGSDGGHDLFDRLAADPRLPLGVEDLSALLSDPLAYAGDSARQVRAFVDEVARVVARHPDAATYQPEPIL